MNKYLITLLTFFFLAGMAICQDLPKGFTIQKVNKMVKEYPDITDLSSPLKTRITVGYIWIDGKEGKYNDIKPGREKFMYPPMPRIKLSAKNTGTSI